MGVISLVLFRDRTSLSIASPCTTLLLYHTVLVSLLEFVKLVSIHNLRSVIYIPVDLPHVFFFYRDLSLLSFLSGNESSKL